MILLLFITNELNFDKFNKKSDNIVRTSITTVVSGNTKTYMYGPAPLATALEDDYSEVITATRLNIKKNLLPVFRLVV